MTVQQADIITSNHGSIWTFSPETTAGEEWIGKHWPGQVWIEVDHRYGMDIACGMLRDGLQLQDSATGRFATLPAED